jgi:peptidylprolyl isomerase
MKVEKGNNVKVHYTGTLTDGQIFDSSHDRGETLNFTIGSGQMIQGFDDAIIGMEVGETKNITLTPDMAYGDRYEEAIQPVSRQNFPENFEVQIGEMVQGSTAEGMPIQAVIIGEDEENIILDMNHPLAGKELNFKIELVEIG